MSAKFHKISLRETIVSLFLFEVSVFFTEVLKFDPLKVYRSFLFTSKREEKVILFSG